MNRKTKEQIIGSLDIKVTDIIERHLEQVVGEKPYDITNETIETAVDFTAEQDEYSAEVTVIFSTDYYPEEREDSHTHYTAKHLIKSFAYIIRSLVRYEHTFSEQEIEQLNN